MGTTGLFSDSDKFESSLEIETSLQRNRTHKKMNVTVAYTRECEEKPRIGEVEKRKG